MWYMTLSLCLAAALAGADSGAAPFITPCQSSDNACIVASAQAAVEPIAAGIPALGIQPLDPMHIDKIVGNQGGLELQFLDTIVTGLKGCKIENIK
ncbi:Juvenile hormone-binding protein [Eumeta japonica]|uniref:Juvenile hormone-binding protein n=1 Tax=Eumeta variegata TaxID=151549 RepID=A0A4C1Y4E9_EUMVA|nr:Juvenile hormone-binding protein [Eumeta japonica]